MLYLKNKLVGTVKRKHKQNRIQIIVYLSNFHELLSLSYIDGHTMSRKIYSLPANRWDGR